MHNGEVARIFQRIAALLELKGDEGGFRVRSYRRAARSIQESATPVEQLAREGRLKEIPGVGDAIARKIAEIVTTSKLDYYDRLAAQFPQSLIALLDVPGIGPKTALFAVEALGLTTLDELAEAAHDGRLAALPRLDATAAANVLGALVSTYSGETHDSPDQTAALHVE